MSTLIKNVALHQLVQEESGELLLVSREQLLDHIANTEALVHELHRTFSTKPSKGFGLFKSDSQVNALLKETQSGNKEFFEFAKVSAELLHSEITKYPFAEPGLVVMAEYQSLATDYLLIAMVPMSQSLKVTDALDIGATDYLDINKMDIVARLDLTVMATEPENNRYLSFLKGRVGRKVSDFFLDFLQAEVGLDTKSQNQVLAQAVQDFCTDGKLSKEETTSFKKQVADYCNTTMKDGDEVVLKDLSSELPPSESGVSFLDYTKEKGYELEDEFPADKPTVRKLTKYVGAGGGINISFDALLLGERVFYDPETDTITIKGTPPNIRDQLTRNAQ